MTLRTPLIFLLGLFLGLAVRTGMAQEDRRLPGGNGINTSRSPRRSTPR
jgi:hypothetical protein